MDHEPLECYVETGFLSSPEIYSEQNTVELRSWPSLLDHAKQWHVLGGTGSIGSLVSSWLTLSFKGSQVFVYSRRGYNKLIDIFQCDFSSFMTDATGKEPSFDLNRPKPLSSWVFSQGVISDYQIFSQSPLTMRKAISSKMDSFINIYQSPCINLISKTFVFSSITSAFPNKGQVNYSTANNALELAAKEQVKKGVEITCIQWGPWSIGMTKNNPKLRHKLHAIGMGLISPANGLFALEGILRQPTNPCRRDTIGLFSGSPLHVPHRQSYASDLEVVVTQSSNMVVKSAALKSFMKDTLKSILSVEIEEEDLFMDSGLDSFGSVELRNEIVSKFGLDLPSTVVFDYPTINAITDYIISKKSKQGIKRVERNLLTTWNTVDKPMAVKCVSCRYPGEANAGRGIALMERRITRGDESNSEIPYSRWDIDNFYSLDNKEHSSIYTRSGSFLDDSIYYFDRELFHLSMQQSVWIDPQIRLLLEEHTAIYYLMHSLVDLESTGILVGCMFHEHMSSIEKMTNNQPPPHAIVGNGSPYMAGRLSFNFGMNGISTCIDTACSSSLVAAHISVSCLRQRELKDAFVSGVNLILNPSTFSAICHLRALSAVGRCLTFDASADGYGRSEGASVAFITQLSSPQSQYEDVYAILRRVVVNQDGRSSSLTAPNGVAQVALHKVCLEESQVEPGEVKLQSVHGTGTPLGDPIELNSILNAHSSEVKGVGLTLFAPKACLGHMEGNAGSAGLLASACFLSSATVGPIITLRNLNSYLETPINSWKENCPTIPRNTTCLPCVIGEAFAGTSSFGMSGTNAHALLLSPSNYLKDNSDFTGWRKGRSTLPLVIPKLISLSLKSVKNSKLELRAGVLKSFIDGSQSQAHFGVFLELSTAIVKLTLEETCFALNELIIKTPGAEISNGFTVTLEKILDTIEISADEKRICSCVVTWRQDSRSEQTFQKQNRLLLLDGTIELFVAKIGQVNIPPGLFQNGMHTEFSALQATLALEEDAPYAQGIRCCSGIVKYLTQDFFALCTAERIQIGPEKDFISIFGLLKSPLRFRFAKDACGFLYDFVPEAGDISSSIAIDLKGLSSLHLLNRGYSTIYSFIMALKTALNSKNEERLCLELVENDGNFTLAPNKHIRVGPVTSYMQGIVSSLMHDDSCIAALCENNSDDLIKRLILWKGDSETRPDGLDALHWQHTVLHKVIIPSTKSCKLRRSILRHCSQCETKIIIGGTGGIGSLVTSWSLKSQVRGLNLSSRTGRFNNSGIFQSYSLDSGNLCLQAVDMGSLDESFTFWDRLRSATNRPHLLHAAGVQRHLMLNLIFPQEVRYVSSSKEIVFGQIFSKLNGKIIPFGSCLIFSSIASLLGSRGQANYCASNAVLDSMSLYHNQEGISMQSVQWGAWMSVGMAAKTFNISNEKGIHLGLLSCSMGLSSLEVILRDFCRYSIVGAVPPTYWNLVRSRLKKVPNILQNIISRKEVYLERGKMDSEHLSLGHAKPGSDAGVESVLRLMVTDILERTPSPSEPLGLQGLNSLSVLELRSSLEAKFGSNILPDEDLMGMTLETLTSSVSVTIVEPVLQQQKQKTSILDISPCPIFVKMRIFCLPWAGGLSENLFAHWGMLTPSCLQICPVEIPGRGRRSSESSIASIRQLVDLLANSLPFDDKPYAIFGTCLGGIIGYEIIQELRRQNRRLPLIFMPAAVSPPHVYSKVVMKIYTDRRLSKLKFVVVMHETMQMLINSTRHCPSGRNEDPDIDEVMSLLDNWRSLPKDKVLRAFEAGHFAGIEEMKASDQLYKRVAPIAVNDIKMAVQYAFDSSRDRLPVPIIAFEGSRDNTIPRNYMRMWSNFTTSTFEKVEIDSDHYFAAKKFSELITHISEACMDMLNLYDGESMENHSWVQEKTLTKMTTESTEEEKVKSRMSPNNSKKPFILLLNQILIFALLWWTWLLIVQQQKAK
eukprot:jgi/Picsp_1/2675/NSC_00905-R1_beta-ketoacyl synthase